MVSFVQSEPVSKEGASDSPLSTIDFVERFKHSLIDKIWRGLFLIVLLSLPLGFYSASRGGWTLAHTFHMLLVGMLSLLVARIRHLSLYFKTVTLGLICWTVGVFGLSRHGIMATEWWYAVLGIIVIGVMLSRREAIAMFVACALTLLSFMFAFVSGSLVLEPKEYEASRMVVTWILLGFSSMMLPAIVLQQFRANQLALFDLLSEVERQRDIIAQQVDYDALTGLPSRRLGLDRLEMAARRVRRNDSSAALLFLDLDGFKAVNDQWGHAAGDAVLRAVGERLTSLLRADDTVARYAGDEFLVILDLTHYEDAAVVAEKIIAQIEHPVPFGATTLQVSASVGITRIRAGLTRDALVAEADGAMYGAKAGGKGRFVFAVS